MGALKSGCERAREWVSLELDDELSELQRAQLRAHLAHCPVCGAVEPAVRAVTELLRDADEEEPESTVVVPVPRPALRLPRLALAAAVVAVAVGALAGSISPEPSAALRMPYFEHQLLTKAHSSQS